MIDVSKLLRSLTKNEQPWEIRSGRSEEMSKSLRSLTKNERMSESLIFLRNNSFAHFWAKNERFDGKSNERIPSSVLKCPGDSGPRCDAGQWGQQSQPQRVSSLRHRRTGQRRLRGARYCQQGSHRLTAAVYDSSDQSHKLTRVHSSSWAIEVLFSLVSRAIYVLSQLRNEQFPHQNRNVTRKPTYSRYGNILPLLFPL